MIIVLGSRGIVTRDVAEALACVAQKYRSRVRIGIEDHWVEAADVPGVMALGDREAGDLRLWVVGPDQVEAAWAIRKFLVEKGAVLDDELDRALAAACLEEPEPEAKKAWAWTRFRARRGESRIREPQTVRRRRFAPSYWVPRLAFVAGALILIMVVYLIIPAIRHIRLARYSTGRRPLGEEIAILAPTGWDDTDSLVRPAVKWHNQYGVPMDFTAFFCLRDPAGAHFYVQSTAVAGLAPGADTVIAFPECDVGEQVGTWTTQCSTHAGNMPSPRKVKDGTNIMYVEWNGHWHVCVFAGRYNMPDNLPLLGLDESWQVMRDNHEKRGGVLWLPSDSLPRSFCHNGWARFFLWPTDTVR